MSDEDLKQSAIWELTIDLRSRKISPEARIKVIDKIREIEQWEDPETITSLLEPLAGSVEALKVAIGELKSSVDTLPGDVVAALAEREEAINQLLAVVRHREAERSE